MWLGSACYFPAIGSPSKTTQPIEGAQTEQRTDVNCGYTGTRSTLKAPVLTLTCAGKYSYHLDPRRFRHKESLWSNLTIDKTFTASVAAHMTKGIEMSSIAGRLPFVSCNYWAVKLVLCDVRVVRMLVVTVSRAELVKKCTTANVRQAEDDSHGFDTTFPPFWLWSHDWYRSLYTRNV